MWIHWAVAIFFLVQLVYRPTYGMGDGVPYWLLLALLVAFNAYVHYRLRSSRPVIWRWVLGLIAMDVVMLSIAVVIGGGFKDNTGLNRVSTTSSSDDGRLCRRR